MIKPRDFVNPEKWLELAIDGIPLLAGQTIGRAWEAGISVQNRYESLRESAQSVASLVIPQPELIAEAATETL